MAVVMVARVRGTYVDGECECDGDGGDWYPAKEGEGGERGRGRDEDAQHVLQRHP